jgi:hypothetical protein
MAEDNLSGSPEPVAVPMPPTQDDLVEDISNLLEPPETDQHEEPEEAAAPTEEDDPLGLAEDVEEPDDPDESEADGPDAEIKGGRFAPDNAKLKLDNGETITVRDLKDRVEKRVKDFQRDYTEKAQALSAEKAEVSQYAQTLDQSREYLAWYAEQFLPKQPEPFKGDASANPMGFLEWQQSVAQWQAHAQAWQQFQQSKEAENERKAGETQKQMQERLKRERDALMTAIPVLKDPVKGKQVWDNILSGATQHYGIAPEEVNSTADHRFIKVLRDALAYRRIKAAAPTVQAEVTKRPVVNNGRRAAPNAAQTREKQARTERLRSDPSFQNGVAALMDFDL